MTVAPAGERLVIYLDSRRDLFDAVTIERLLARFEVLLAGAVAAPERRLEDLPLLDGALVSDRRGRTAQFALMNLQERGTLFVGPGDEVYEGMIVGENARADDLDVNATKEKQLNNIRSSTSEVLVRLVLAPLMQLKNEVERRDVNDLSDVDAVVSRHRPGDGASPHLVSRSDLAAFASDLAHLEARALPRQPNDFVTVIVPEEIRGTYAGIAHPAMIKHLSDLGITAIVSATPRLVPIV